MALRQYPGRSRKAGAAAAAAVAAEAGLPQLEPLLKPTPLRAQLPERPAHTSHHARWGYLLAAVCSFAFLAYWLVYLRVTQPQDRPPLGRVQVSSQAPGFSKALAHSELEELYQDNLEQDLAPFRRPGGWGMGEFEDFIRGLIGVLPTDNRANGRFTVLVLIQNNKVQGHWLRGQDAFWRYACLEHALKVAVQQGLAFPDTAFVVTIDDYPFCVPGMCPLPMFTFFKKWRGRNVDTNEVLLPIFNHHYEELYTFPWWRKSSKGFLRASQQGCMPPNNSRLAIAAAFSTHPQYLDAGITKIADSSYKAALRDKVSTVNFVAIEDHAKWKYLIATDGCVGSARLGKLLLTNSVVLREESDWIEYYYRSLKPWHHYVPFNPGGGVGEKVVSLVKRLRANDSQARAIAFNGQHWAHRHITNSTRLLYLHQAIVRYTQLFGGRMEAWVASGGPERLLANPKD